MLFAVISTAPAPVCTHLHVFSACSTGAAFPLILGGFLNGFFVPLPQIMLYLSWAWYGFTFIWSGCHTPSPLPLQCHGRPASRNAAAILSKAATHLPSLLSLGFERVTVAASPLLLLCRWAVSGMLIYELSSWPISQRLEVSGFFAVSNTCGGSFGETLEDVQSSVSELDTILSQLRIPAPFCQMLHLVLSSENILSPSPNVGPECLVKVYCSCLALSPVCLCIRPLIRVRNCLAHRCAESLQGGLTAINGFEILDGCSDIMNATVSSLHMGLQALGGGVDMSAGFLEGMLDLIDFCETPPLHVRGSNVLSLACDVVQGVYNLLYLTACTNQA